MRLIDADALIENHFSNGHRISMGYADKAWMRSIIRNEPTIDAVPVVRCRECKFYKTMWCQFDTWTMDVTIYEAKPDDYCSRGQAQRGR